MSKRIKGITIEIDGETKGLEKALSSVTKESMGVGKELKDVQRLLKLNPGNTELIAQQQQLLSKQIEITSTKLKGLRDAQEQVDQQFKNGEISEEQYRAFNREIEATEGALKGYKGQLANVQTEQDRLGQNTNRLDSFFKATGTSVEDFQDVLGSRLTNAIKNGTASADDMEVALNKIGKSALGSEVDIGAMKETLDKVDDGASLETVGKELDDLKPKANDSSDALEKVEGAINAGVMMDVADKVAGVGEKIKELGDSAMEAFREVDDGLDIIVTKTGASGSAMEDMGGIYTRISSKMPVEMSKVGEAIGEVNTQLGAQGNELEKASEQAIQFSEINGQDVTSTVVQAKQALSAYSLENKDFGMVLDTVTKVAQDTGQATGDLFKKATEGAPQIKSLGLEFSEGVALMGSFEKAGVDSSAALSSLGKASVVYAKDGKTLEQGLKGTMDAIKGAKSDTEALTIASEVFGTKGAVRMADAIKRGTITLDSFGNTATDAAGKTAKTFEDTLDPIDEVTVAQNNMTLGMAELGDAIAATLAPMLQTLSTLIQNVSSWFAGLSPNMQQVIVVIGLLMVAFTGILPVAVAIGVAVTTLGTALLPIIGIVAGVIAGVTALIVVIQNWSVIVQWISQLFSKFGIDLNAIWLNIKTTILSVVQSVVTFVMQIWGTLVSWWNQNNQLIMNTAKIIWNSISSVIKTVMGVLGPFITTTWNNIKITIQTVWSTIQTVVKTAINVVLGIIKTVMQIINGDWSGAWNSIKGIVSTVWNGIKSVVSSAVHGVKNTVSNTFKGLVSVVSGIWDGIKSAIEKPINAAKEAVGRAIEAIKGLFNFKFSWPKIPLPHFSISGSANPIDWIKKGTLPKISVDWFAKGGILTKPTVFGQNGNSLMVGGEAGKEAVAPIDTLMGYVRQAVAEATTDSNRQPLIVNQYITSPQPLTPREMEREAYFYLRNLAK